MNEFQNVTVAKNANVYFDGKVTSRTLTFQDGSKKTLGIMMPGVYQFGTSEHEIMEILSGELELLLSEESEWKNIKGGESFEVEANKKFDVKIKTITDYCCSYR